uniref:helix-turn-helix domain-containing protein n=1 Tax=Agathobacter sp. TaxID=2021311 RepID=UPI004056F30E
MIDFEPLWHTLKEKEISIYKLINTYGMSRGTLDSLKHNRNVTLNTVNWLCDVLECDITKVVRYTPDKAKVEETVSGEAENTEES